MQEIVLLLGLLAMVDILLRFFKSRFKLTLRQEDLRTLLYDIIYQAVILAISSALFLYRHLPLWVFLPWSGVLLLELLFSKELQFKYIGKRAQVPYEHTRIVFFEITLLAIVTFIFALAYCCESIRAIQAVVIYSSVMLLGRRPIPSLERIASPPFLLLLALLTVTTPLIAAEYSRPLALALLVMGLWAFTLFGLIYIKKTARKKLEKLMEKELKTTRR